MPIPTRSAERDLVCISVVNSSSGTMDASGSSPKKDRDRPFSWLCPTPPDITSFTSNLGRQMCLQKLQRRPNNLLRTRIIIHYIEGMMPCGMIHEINVNIFRNCHCHKPRNGCIQTRVVKTSPDNQHWSNSA